MTVTGFEDVILFKELDINYTWRRKLQNDKIKSLNSPGNPVSAELIVQNSDSKLRWKPWRIYEKFGLFPWLFFLFKKSFSCRLYTSFFFFSFSFLLSPLLRILQSSPHTLNVLLYSLIHLFAHPVFVESYHVTDNIPKVLEIQWWAKSGKVPALMNSYLQVKRGWITIKWSNK